MTAGGIDEHLRALSAIRTKRATRKKSDTSGSEVVEVLWKRISKQPTKFVQSS